MTAVVAARNEGTLAQRSDIEQLRHDQANVAGFWTLAGLADSAAFGQDEFKQALSKLGQSEVPIYGRMSLFAAGPRAQVDAHVPAQLFRDIAAAATKR
jgi:hypothetical protein